MPLGVPLGGATRGGTRGALLIPTDTVGVCKQTNLIGNKVVLAVNYSMVQLHRSFKR